MRTVKMEHYSPLLIESVLEGGEVQSGAFTFKSLV